MRKCILVIGGAGFIGSHSVDRLLAEGYSVRVLDNFSTGRWENLPSEHPRLEILVGDIAEEELWEPAFADVDAVLHLAAQVSVQKSIENPVRSCAENIQNFVIVLELARKRAVRVVYASSAAVYGDPQSLPAREADLASPISPYGLEKYTNELYAALYHKMYGLSHLGLRYFNVYGPRQDPHSPYSGVISRFLEQMRSGRPLTIRGDGLQERDFVHVFDVARANVAALFSTSNGVINIGSGEAVSILGLGEMLLKLHGQGDISWVPAIPGDIRHSCADISMMRSVLGPPSTPLAAGLQQLLEKFTLAAL
ncbi:NAD-dependent epimerase/dehydratase family protein [Acidithiobacillus sp. AMEEHan]|uniref:NAD-dependent epimerase/dehydratase family protein n=1 Tax=Acidithiobacillus sp. AMEEHan TaxID=2994951 RepID=UPI0027E3FF7F|nr:NAD-dependent epimerase/dehydratase family protein [Acidithiobacillus sp. AMEEHan]